VMISVPLPLGVVIGPVGVPVGVVIISVGVVMISVGVVMISVGVVVMGSVPFVGVNVTVGVGRVMISDPLAVDDGPRRLDKMLPRGLVVVVAVGTSVTTEDVATAEVIPALDVGLSPLRREDNKSVVSAASLVLVSVAPVPVLVGSAVFEVSKRVDSKELMPGRSPPSVDSVAVAESDFVMTPDGPKVIALSVSGNRVVSASSGERVVVGLTMTPGISPVEEPIRGSVSPVRGSVIPVRSRPVSLLVGLSDVLSGAVVVSTCLVV